MKKVYCYVDETGQDTEGMFFLVVVVLLDDIAVENVELKIEEIEMKTHKKQLKWGKTPFKVRSDYLLKVSQLQELRKSFYFSIYYETKEYVPCVSTAIAKAIFTKGIENYQVTVVIDGLTRKGIEQVRKQLKKLKVHYSKVKGLKEEQTVFLRLADAVAGFVRDVQEGQEYAQLLYYKLQKEGMFIA